MTNKNAKKPLSIPAKFGGINGVLSPPTGGQLQSNSESKNSVRRATKSTRSRH